MILSCATFLGGFSLINAWWIHDTHYSGTFSNSVEDTRDTYGPFNDGREDVAALEGEVFAIGIFASLALALLVAALGLDSGPLLGKASDPVYRNVALAVTAAFGGSAALFALFWLPAAVQVRGFWSTSQNRFAGTTATHTFFAGWGWYAAILGFLLLPASAYAISTLRERWARRQAAGDSRVAEVEKPAVSPVGNAKTVDRGPITERPRKSPSRRRAGPSVIKPGRP